MSFLLGLLRALPALERLVRLALTEIDQEREREAARRLQEKDAHVDELVDRFRSHEGQ